MLQDEYHEWDSIPDLVLAELLNVNFEENIMSPVPGEAGENNTYNEYEEDF